MPDNVLTYGVSEDCLTVTATVTDLTALDLTATIRDGASVTITSELDIVGDVATITFSIENDGVFYLTLESFDDGILLEDAPMFVACRAYKCFTNINDESTELLMANKTDNFLVWLLIKALLISAAAFFRSGEFAESNEILMVVLPDACETLNCSCGC